MMNEPIESNDTIITKFIYLGIIIFFFIIGFYIGSINPNQDVLDRKYNEGYGDAMMWAIEQQHTLFDFDDSLWYNKSFEPVVIHDSGNYTYGNFTNESYISLTNCTQNETGYDPNDLVMHLVCDG